VHFAEVEDESGEKHRGQSGTCERSKVSVSGSNDKGMKLFLQESVVVEHQTIHTLFENVN
jgi:hypothetical protein